MQETTPEARMDQSSQQPQLLSQVAWFNRLRFGAVFGMISAGTLGEFLGLLPDVVPIYVLAAVTLGLNLVLPSLPAGVDAVTGYAQVLVARSDGETRLGAPSTILMLDVSY